MKKTILLYFLANVCLSAAFGQTQNTSPRRAVLQIKNSDFQSLPATVSGEGSQQYTMSFEMPLQKGASSFLAFSANWVVENCPAAEVQIFVRFKSGQTMPEAWQLLETDPHGKTDSHREVSTLLFLEKEYNSLEIKTLTPSKNCLPQQVQLHFYNPGISQKTSPADSGTNDRSLCQCSQPAHLDREDWCPTGDCDPNPDPSPTNVTHFIIHHTATSNTASDWAAVVRAIWDFHVNNNGWSDIGYNWLIDPNGVLYQGRGDNEIGAHFCGTNTNTMGTAVIGDFTNAEPTDLAKNTLVELLSWKACDEDIDPLGTAWHPPSGQTLHNLVGHRDGCSTSCPGDLFYPQVPDIRQSVVDFIENECSTTTTVENAFLNGQTVRLFPNPTDGELNGMVENGLNLPISFQLVDALSRTVLVRKAIEKPKEQAGFSLDLSGLPAGVYWLFIRQGEAVTVRRIMVL